MSAHSPMVVRVARELCKRNSETCGINNEDNWQHYGHCWLEDAKAAIDAAGTQELLEALRPFAMVCEGSEMWALAAFYIKRAQAAIAKATGEQP